MKRAVTTVRLLAEAKNPALHKRFGIVAPKELIIPNWPIQIEGHGYARPADTRCIFDIASHVFPTGHPSDCRGIQIGVSTAFIQSNPYHRPFFIQQYRCMGRSFMPVMHCFLGVSQPVFMLVRQIEASRTRSRYRLAGRDRLRSTQDVTRQGLVVGRKLWRRVSRTLTGLCRNVHENRQTKCQAYKRKAVAAHAPPPCN